MTMGHDNNLPALDAVGKAPHWLAFIHDEAIVNLLNQIALKDSSPLACIQKGDLQTLRTFLTGGITPQIVILDLTSSLNILEEANKALVYCGPNTHLIVIGKDDHVSIFRELKHAGITDYLIFPLNENDLYEAIEEASILPRITPDSSANMRPFTSIIGVRGGVGASTLSTNLAWMTFKDFQKKVCLIDFDVYNTTISILLDLIPNTGLNDVINEIDRADEVFLKRVMLQKEEGFSILTGQLGLEYDINFPPDAINALINLLKDNYECIFADLPFSTLHSPFSQTLLGLTDNVLIVTDLSLISVQAILRLKSFLATYLPHLQSKIIVNNIFPDGGTISEDMFSKSTNLIVGETLPYCKADMLEGANAGDTFVKTHPNHAYTNALRAILLKMYPQLKLKEEIKPGLVKKLLASLGINK